MFSIYVPQGRGEATSLLRKVGAEWALDRSVTAMGSDVREGGPDGGGGTLIHFDGRSGAALHPITMIEGPETQRWEPVSKRGDQAEGRFWIGVRRGESIGPEDLVREDVSDGIAVTMLDGREWVVPIADYLPRRLTIEKSTGEQKYDVLPDHAEFVQKTNEMFELLVSDDFQKTVADALRVVIPNGLRYAADALQKNYRVNLDLIDMLGICGEIEAVKVAAIATGLELYSRVGDLKKSALLAATSSDG